MLSPETYFPRDLSWLSFNYRVLLEARDEDLPLYERIKFLAIYSANLEEFFKVRVASLQSVRKLTKQEIDFHGDESSEILEAIYTEVHRQQQEFGEIFREMILPALEQAGVRLMMDAPASPVHKHFVEQYFDEEVKAYLHPELLRKNKITHFLRDGALYISVKLRNRPRNYAQLLPAERKVLGENQKLIRYALIQVPTHYFPRFIQLPEQEGKVCYMFLDDIIRYNLDRIFHGYDLIGAYTIKMNRSAELNIEEEFGGNELAQKLQSSLKLRQVGLPARFLYDEEMPKSMLKYLRETFDVRKRELMPGGKHHSFQDFFQFPNPVSPQLEREPTPPLPHPQLEEYVNLFDAIRDRNWLLHFPYQSYDYVVRFFNQAATDPQVTHLYATQYRVARGSAIVGGLIRAARNGKVVKVFVEIKARFDEATNLQFAQEMEQAGVQICYSFPDLKVHAKVGLVRRETDQGEEWHAFLSTGNFNEKTARIYGDHGFFTSDTQITSELREVFRHLFDREYKPVPFQKLLVAQFNMRAAFEKLIQQEMAYAQAGKPAKILIKLNNLEDPEMIECLYAASQAGVHIQLIIRGICCLRPQVSGLSENIWVTRVVDQFLEHARVFVFHQLGADLLYLASSDWMSRNLNRRIEVGFPILHPDLRAEVLAILELQLADTVKAVRLDADMRNCPIPPQTPAIRCQTEIYRRLKEGSLADGNLSSKYS